MDNIDYLEGFFHSSRNSKNLFLIAETSSKEGLFGLGCSLNILAAEEALKANFLLMRHTIGEYDIEGLNKLFKYHKFKHDQLKEIYEWQDNFLELIEEQNKIEEEKLSKQGFSKQEIKQMFDETEYYSIINKKITLLKQNKPLLEEAIDWFSRANESKNDGLYVNLSKNNWLTPEKFSEDDYLKSKKCSATIIKLNEILFDIHNI